jgi:hypothetical protein
MAVSQFQEASTVLVYLDVADNHGKYSGVCEAGSQNRARRGVLDGTDIRRRKRIERIPLAKKLCFMRRLSPARGDNHVDATSHACVLSISRYRCAN